MSVNPTELRFCRRGHLLSEDNRYTSPHGGTRCLKCKNDYHQTYMADVRAGSRVVTRGTAEKYRHGIRRNDEMPEVQPVAVKWWGYEMLPWASKLRGKAAVRYVVGAFERHHGHSPSIVLCHPANVCRYSEGDERDAEFVLRVSNPGMMEPRISSEIMFFAR